MRESLLIALSTCLTVFLNTNVAAADSEPPVHLAAQHFLDRLPQMAAKQSRGIRWSTGRSGTITGIFGEPLGVNWHSQKIRTNRAASAQAALFFRSFGRAFGLRSGDIIRPIRTTSTASGAATEWTVSLARERDGLRVFNEGATVVIGTDGSLRWLVASFSADPVTLEATSVSTVGSENVQEIGMWAVDGEGVEPKLVPAAVLVSGTIMTLIDHQVVAESRDHDVESFDFVVTSRGVASINEISPDYGCTSSTGQAPNVTTECADAGKPAWSSIPLGNPPQKLCCQQCMPDCDPNCAAGCSQLPLYNQDVVNGVRSIGAISSRLSGYGLSTFMAQGPDSPVVLSPQDHAGALKACDMIAGQPAACPNMACMGKDIGTKCALAFRTLKDWSDAACLPALGNARGVILATAEASKSLGVLGHEYGHLWQRSHGIVHPEWNHLLSQPATINESIADAFGLLSMDTGWRVGADSDCAHFRNACRPDCAAPAADEPDATCTADPGPGLAQCTTGQPRHYRDYQLKPDPNSPDAAHFNTGIANFAHFLMASTATHSVGNQVIQGQGRAALAQVLLHYPDKFATATAEVDDAAGTPGSVGGLSGDWTFDGFREAMLQSAFSTNPAFGTQLARAYDATGIWRADASTSLYGIDRVAMMAITGAAAPQPTYPPEGIRYLVNYDGVHRNISMRCVPGTPHISCSTPVALEPPFVEQPYPPYGAPSSIQLADGSAVLFYPTEGGQIAMQHFLAAGPEVPVLIPQTPTLFGPGWTTTNGMLDSIRAYGIGAARTSSGDTLLTYLCVEDNCSCAGQLAANNNPMVCVRNLDGTVETIVAHLPMASADVRRDHAPAIAVSNGIPVIVWVQSDGQQERVFWSLQPNPAVPGNWTQGLPWQTAGETTARDLPSLTSSLIAVGSIPGAGNGSLDEPQDRLYIQYKPQFQATRAYAFASAVFMQPAVWSWLLGDEQYFTKASMGVAQPQNAVKVLEGVGSTVANPVAPAQAVAGGFIQWDDRTYAAVRITSSGDEPTYPSYEGTPLYGEFVPPVHYGRVIVRSVGWR